MLLPKSKVTSKKFSIYKFTLTVILSPQFLNILMTFFFVFPANGLNKSYNTVRQSPLISSTEWIPLLTFHRLDFLYVFFYAFF